ncbi:O-antigen ligase family protein [Barnesiella sp. WM24]|uniref:O-antigen ligase family protein n=1 Tax=Barnesiella sp. WM24 TaxID=2558278 RepID=UPI001ADDBBC1|nr:O-antigen ligase family protein [Barnesiella sp. WM24]
MKTEIADILIVSLAVILLPLMYTCAGFIFSREILGSAVIVILGIYLLLRIFISNSFHSTLNIGYTDIIVAIVFIIGCIYKLSDGKGAGIDTMALLILYMVIRRLRVTHWMYIAFSISGTVQGAVVIFQAIGMVGSINNIHEACGTFYNPGQAGCFIAICSVVTVGYMLASRSRTAIVFLVVQLAGLIVCDSRTAWVAVVAAVLYLLIRQYNLKINAFKIFLTLIVFALFFLLLVCYRYESVAGRFLVWKISAQMFSASPILGLGAGSFSDNYMLYQALYFKENPSSQLSGYADDVMMPFNEYVCIGVQYGIFGVLILMALIYSVFKLPNKCSTIWRGAVIALLVIGLFSYPTEIYPILSLATIIVAFAACHNLRITIQFNFSYRLKLACALIVGVLIMGSGGYFCRYLRISNNTYSLYVTGKDLSNDDYNRVKNNGFFNEYYIGWLLSDPRATHSERLCDAKPSYQVYLYLGEYHYMRRDYEDAIKYLMTASDMIPCRLRANYYLWKIYKEKKNFTMALEIAQKVLSQEVKIESTTTLAIKRQMRDFINSGVGNFNKEKLEYHPKSQLLRQYTAYQKLEFRIQRKLQF